MVPELPELPLLLLPQLTSPPVRSASNTNIPSIDHQRRRPAGIPKNNKQARAVPPAAYQGDPSDLGRTNAPVVGAVVVTVRVPVPFDAPVMLTGEVAPKLNVGGSMAPLGPDVRAAVRVTLPVKPPLGMTVIVVALPVVAPGEPMLMEPLLVKAKLGAT